MPLREMVRKLREIVGQAMDDVSDDGAEGVDADVPDWVTNGTVATTVDADALLS